MKKIILMAILLVGLNMASSAQTQKAVVKQTVTTRRQTPVVTQKVTTPAKQTTHSTIQTVKAIKPRVAATNTIAVLKKDGTPDKRYNSSKTLKKDGTPDMRYKKNK